MNWSAHVIIVSYRKTDSIATSLQVQRRSHRPLDYAGENDILSAENQIWPMQELAVTMLGVNRSICVVSITTTTAAIYTTTIHINTFCLKKAMHYTV